METAAIDVIFGPGNSFSKIRILSYDRPSSRIRNSDAFLSGDQVPCEPRIRRRRRKN
jgi:hypothetical protein